MRDLVVCVVYQAGEGVEDYKMLVARAEVSICVGVAKEHAARHAPRYLYAY